MAKQQGIHQIRGKVGEMSYYRQKNVVTGLVRGINQGMSKRVKEDAAFANTRLNAAEFGAAGNYAGACVRAISTRWRTILNPFATGHLVKPILEGMKLDTSSAWGQRNLGIDYMEEIESMINQEAKNDYQESFAVPTISVVSHGASSLLKDWEWELIIEDTTSSNLLAKGATGVRYQMYAYRAEFGKYSSIIGKYQKSTSSVVLLGTNDMSIGEESSWIDSTTTIRSTATNEAGVIGALLCVALPYKSIGLKRYFLQELCSFILVNEVSKEE